MKIKKEKNEKIKSRQRRDDLEKKKINFLEKEIQYRKIEILKIQFMEIFVKKIPVEKQKNKKNQKREDPI